MSWQQAQATGEQTRVALESALRQARAIVADADRAGDEVIRDTLARVSDDRSARAAALKEARDQVAGSTARAETELKRFATVLRSTATTTLSGAGA